MVVHGTPIIEWHCLSRTAVPLRIVVNAHVLCIVYTLNLNVVSVVLRSRVSNIISSKPCAQYYIAISVTIKLENDDSNNEFEPRVGAYIFFFFFC